MDASENQEEEKKVKNRKSNSESKPKKSDEKKFDPQEELLKSNNEKLLRTQRRKIIGGVLLMLSSVYLLIALLSFCFTWFIDQDKVTHGHGYWVLLTNNEIEVSNWLGKSGAIVSHWLMQRGMGISSVFITPLLFALGFILTFKIKLFSFTKVLKHSLISMFLGSVILSFIFNQILQTEWFFIGGNFGYQANKWLISLVGLIGTTLLLLTILCGYLYFAINWKNVFKKSKQEQLDNALLNTQTFNDSTDAEPQDAQKKRDWNEIKEEQEKSLSTLINPHIANQNTENTEQNEINKTEENEELLQTKEFVMSPLLKIEKLPAKNEDDIELIVEHQIQPEVEFIQPHTDEPENFELPHAQGDFDPKADLSSYVFPEIDLLEKHGNDSITINNDELQANKDRILDTLKNYNIEIEKIKATIGPTVTLYEIIPAPGVRISKIKNLEDDIALSLSALGIRIIAPMPGKGTIGIEVPNQKPEVVSMRSIISSEKFQNTSFDLPIALGKTITNETFIADLAKMPHLLMAGATGQGKSVGLNAILVSLLYKKHPSQIKFVLVDPKKVELTLFNTIERHFLAKLPNAEESIITDTKKVIHTLNSLCILMDTRYELLKNAMVRNIKEYNAKFIARKLNPLEGHHFMPYIVLVVDEFADLIMTAGKEVETPIARLAQLARAIGIHLIIATQRPSVNIITGTIKANFPARIAFRVSSKIDSRTILDTGGAEQLIGRGDMLLSTGNDLIRIQCAFVDTPEVDKITEFIGAQRAYPMPYLLPEYIDENESSEKENIDLSQRDSSFEEAARIIVQHQQGSTSLIQRRLKLGYNRAGRIIDQLEAAGIVGPFEGSKARQVLVKDEQSLEQILKGM